MKNRGAALLLLLIFAFTFVGHHKAHAAQTNPVLPTSSPYPGLTMLSNLNSIFQGILTTNSGATAPSYGVEGTIWTDSTNTILKLYSGSNWLNLGTFSSTQWAGVNNGVPYTIPSSTGSANAYVVTYAPVPTALVVGQHYSFRSNFANTGAATENANGLGAKAITKQGAVPLVSGDIPSGAVVDTVYDGTEMQMTSQPGNAAAGSVTSVATSGQVCGGPITSSGTVSLCTQATGTVLANTTGSTAAPTPVAISSLITSVSAPQGRLSLTSGAPVMSGDVVSTTTIYYMNYLGASVPYYTGSADAADTITSGQVSTIMAASGTGVTNSGGVFDLWWAHGGASHLCVATNGSGGGWASDTAGSNSARGTGYSQLDRTTRPYITNKNSIAHCYNGATDYGALSANQATYLGTIYTTSAGHTSMVFKPSATAGGTGNVLGLSNGYNRVNVTSSESDSNSTFSGIGSWTPVDQNALNSVTFVDGLAASQIRAAETLSTIGSAGWSAGINLDSTSGAPIYQTIVNSTINVQTTPIEAFAPQTGVHAIYGMQLGSVTFQGAPYYVLRISLDM